MKIYIFCFLCLFVFGQKTETRTRPLIYWTDNNLPKHQTEFEQNTIHADQLLKYFDPKQKRLTFAFIVPDTNHEMLYEFVGRIEDSAYNRNTVTMPFVEGTFDPQKLTKKYTTHDFTTWSDFNQNVDKTTNLVTIKVANPDELYQQIAKAEAAVTDLKAYRRGYFMTMEAPKDIAPPLSSFRGTEYVREFVSNNSTDIGAVYQGPVSLSVFTLQSLLVFLVLLIGMCCASNCLGALMTPITYLHEELPIRKEF